MNSRGLTLTEVIVASVILVLTTGGILLIFSTQDTAVVHTGRKMQASDFASQTLEELKNAVREDSWSAGDLSLGAHPKPIQTAGDFRDTFNGLRSYQVDAGPADDAYRKVTVTVEWQEPAETQ